MGKAWDALTGKKDPYADWRSGETPEQYKARKAEEGGKKKPSLLDTVMAPARAREKLIGGLKGKKGS